MTFAKVGRSALTVVSMSFFVCLSCSQAPKMTERLPPICGINPNNYADIPIILVGVITENTTPVGKFHPARYDSRLLTRCYRLQIKVENVIQGDVMPGKAVNVFFFIDTSNLASSKFPISFPPGTREMLFLQRDYGELRTINDNYSNQCAVKVLSGEHPNFIWDPSKPTSEVLTDLLLTRGKAISDKQMIEAINFVGGYSPFGEEATIKGLQQVAKKETLSVREAACSLLKLRKKPCR